MSNKNVTFQMKSVLKNEFLGTKKNKIHSAMFNSFYRVSVISQLLKDTRSKERVNNNNNRPV